MSYRPAPSPRVYISRFSERTRERDLDDIFYRYGRIRDIEMKNGYAFIEFDHVRDAEDAVYDLNGRTVDGCRVIVEFARPRGGRFRDDGPGGFASNIKCYSCGEIGHKSHACPHGSEPLCFGCRQPGHIRADCPNEGGAGGPGRSGGSRSPPRGRSRSRSRSPRPHSRSRSRSPGPRPRSRSRSPSPKPKSP